MIGDTPLILIFTLKQEGIDELTGTNSTDSTLWWRSTN